jgi:hypothetical protein
MKIIPQSGIDNLLFGMKQPNVNALYGQPDKKFDDDEGNVIWVYNLQKLRLTFYKDEDFRLGYIISSSPDLTLFDAKVIGEKPNDVKANLLPKGIKIWEQEDFDFAENYFNEDQWLILQSEFGTVSKIELGAIINAKDEFEWKFKP